MSRDLVLDNHILSMIINNEIHEQSELQNLLKQQGHHIPQATLSRHLKRLNIAKVSGTYQLIAGHQSHLPLILNMNISDFGLIILHTHPGEASSLGYFFDQKYVSFSPKQKKHEGLLGTIAGDDTLLLIMKNQQEVELIINLIKEDFPYLSH